MLHNPYSSHYHEVPNPTSPFDQPIPGGVVPGKQIYISGHVRHHVDRLQFNLMGRGGYVFHINPRFNDGAVVRNSENYGAWGPEERTGPFPFQRGQHFELVISVDHDRYRVTVNGVHAFDYNHRIPYQEAERLSINGELDIHRIVYSGGYSFRGNEVYNPPLPFATPVLNGAQPGRLIQIQGVVPHHANRISINLQDGPAVHPPNINLHFNPRFDQNAVVRTNCRYGGWGHEEREGGFPFQKGASFEILILVEPHEFKIAVNGHHFASFAHRNALHEANHLEINGDVEITAVRQF